MIILNTVLVAIFTTVSVLVLSAIIIALFTPKTYTFATVENALTALFNSGKLDQYSEDYRHFIVKVLLDCGKVTIGRATYVVDREVFNE